MKVIDLARQLQQAISAHPDLMTAVVITPGKDGPSEVIGVSFDSEATTAHLIVKPVEMKFDGTKIDKAWIDELTPSPDEMPEELRKMVDINVPPTVDWQINPAYANFKGDLSAALVGSRSLQDQIFEQEVAKQIRKDNERAIMERLSSFPDVNQRLQIADILLDGFEKLRKDIEAQYQKK